MRISYQCVVSIYYVDTFIKFHITSADTSRIPDESEQNSKKKTLHVRTLAYDHVIKTQKYAYIVIRTWKDL